MNTEERLRKLEEAIEQKNGVIAALVSTVTKNNEKQKDMLERIEQLENKNIFIQQKIKLFEQKIKHGNENTTAINYGIEDQVRDLKRMLKNAIDDHEKETDRARIANNKLSDRMARLEDVPTKLMGREQFLDAKVCNSVERGLAKISDLIQEGRDEQHQLASEISNIRKLLEK